MRNKKKVSELGEVFTPKHIADRMVEMLDLETNNIPKVLEPGCGNGNFLVSIINYYLRAYNKKRDIKKYIFHIFSRTYGIDLMKDNVLESRNRLKKILHSLNIKYSLDKEFVDLIEKVIDKNIVIGDIIEGIDENGNDIIMYDWMINTANNKIKVKEYNYKTNKYETGFKFLDSKI